MIPIRRSRRLAAAGALLATLACAPARGPAVADAPRVPALRVTQGQSIAAALVAAPPGSVIEVEPGTYHEALTVDTPGITLRGIVRGRERPVLDGRGDLNDAVIASGSSFTMTGFSIRHYKGNGVTTQGVRGVVLSDLEIHDTGLYGVYPVQSSDITVTHCTVTGIVDAAIYVGESNRAFVAYNEVRDNVAGIEIENTNDAEVVDNLARNNTAGILVFVLPGKLQKEGLRTVVHRNWVVDNNVKNFGDPNAIVGQLPSGMGIIVMGADDTYLHDNWVKGNASMGISVVRLAPEHAEKDPALEPRSDRTRIGFNYLLHNGAAPHPLIAGGFGRGADLGWDGTGVGNCADLPDGATRAGAPLPTCPEPARAAPAEAGPAPAPAAAIAAAGRPLPAGARLVSIRGMRYEPRHLEIRLGETVAWRNDDAVTHTVTSGEGATPIGVPLASPFLRRGDLYTHRFDEAGRYEYLCLPHLDQAPMRGATVTVVR